LDRISQDDSSSARKSPLGDLGVIKTLDGSHTLYLKDKDETYHSRHGAIQESRHVFIEAGLKPLVETGSKEIQILEVGFGTGLNALLTYLEAEKNEISIQYTSLEAFPVSSEIVSQLNYGDALNAKAVFQKLHALSWNENHRVSEFFSLQKNQIKLEEFGSDKKFGLIYFDAFAPRVQPELWTEEVFRKIYKLTASDGVLVTYCSKGDVRRAMIAAGFQVEKLPGPPGKREMLRAVKK
jgi:tRNA U34 5-methylaminomethyl-2-thiouridine-forming methyltransferase MnmC